MSDNINNLKNKIDKHFTLERYTNYRNKINNLRSIKKNVRQLANGDNTSRVFVSNVISANGKFTQNVTNYHIQKLIRRKDLRALGITQGINNANIEKLRTMILKKLKLLGFKEPTQGSRDGYNTMLLLLKKEFNSVTNNNNVKMHINKATDIHTLFTKHNNLLNKIIQKKVNTYTHQVKSINNEEKLIKKIEENFNFKSNILRLNKNNHLDMEVFKRVFYNKLRVLYSLAMDIEGLSDDTKKYITNIYNSFINRKFLKYKKYNGKEKNVVFQKNDFIKGFISAYTGIVRIILPIKRWHSKIPTLNKMIEVRTKQYSQKFEEMIQKMNNKNINLLNVNQSYNLSKIPGWEGFHSVVTRKKLNNIKTVANKSIQFNNVPNKNQNLYLTNSENKNSLNINRKHAKLKLQTLSQNLVKFGGFRRIKIGRDPKKLADFSFLIWIDMNHDFGRTSNLQTYKTAFEKNASFYKYLINNSTYEDTINFTDEMEKIIKKLQEHKILISPKEKVQIKNKKGKDKFINKIIEKDHIVNSDKFYPLLENIYNIKSKQTPRLKDLSKIIKEKIGSDRFLITIDSRPSKYKSDIYVPNNKRYIPLTTYLDPGKYFLDTQTHLRRIKNGIKDDMTRNFKPFSINLFNMRFEYELNKRDKRFKIKIGNRNPIIAGLSANAAADYGNYNSYLSKTFGDLMQILDIASTDQNYPIFFMTADQTAAFIYIYIRKYIFGQEKINLIVANESYSTYKIFF